MKYTGVFLLFLLAVLSSDAQNASVASATVSASVIHPVRLSMENNIIEGPVQKKTSGLQSAAFIWLGKRLASFYVEAGETSYSVTATTDNTAIDNLQVIEGKNDHRGTSFCIMPVFSGLPETGYKSRGRCQVLIHFN